MKINISPKKMPERPRPKWPAISLTDEVYDALYAMSLKHNVTMRALANNILLEACNNWEIAIGGERDA